MENEIKVSVIVPCYNVKQYIDECLASLLSQEFSDYEIICVDDGSTDGTDDILDEYADRHDNIVVIHQENRGLGAARNVGFDNAKGEFVAFVDSDDWIGGSFLNDLYYAAQSTASDVAVGNIIQAVPRGNTFDYCSILKHTKRVDTVDAKEKYKLAGVFKHNYVWNKLYRRSTLERIGVRFEEGVIFEDLVFTNKVLYYMRRMVTVPTADYFYRRQQVSLMWGKSDKWLMDFNGAQERALRFRQSINPEIEDITEFDWTEIDKYKINKFTVLTVKTYGLSKLYYLFDKFLIFQKDVKRRMYRGKD